MELYPEMVEAIYRDFKATVKELISKGDTNLTKHVSRNCSWCEFQPLCYGQFTGADLEYIIEKDYIVKDDEEEQTEEN
jgi:hypothetical protein